MSDEKMIEACKQFMSQYKSHFVTPTEWVETKPTKMGGAPEHGIALMAMHEGTGDVEGIKIRMQSKKLIEMLNELASKKGTSGAIKEDSLKVAFWFAKRKLVHPGFEAARY